jgi:hypothetical protein
MASVYETILQAMFAALEGVSGAVSVERNSAIPETVPADGLIIFRDGKTEPTEPVLGGVGTIYMKSTPQIEVYVQNGDAATRDTKYDAIMTAIGAALAADPTFGGNAYGIIIDRPEPMTDPIPGAPGLKAATIDIHVEYQAPSALG